MEQWVEDKWVEKNRKRDKEIMDRIKRVEKRLEEISKEIREMIIGIRIEN